jgi:hypothetical protein
MQHGDWPCRRYTCNSPKSCRSHREGRVIAKYITFASWEDSPHLDAEAKRGLLSSYLPHERDARTKGIPSLGAGAIYPVPEEDVLCDPFEFPAYFRHAYALDVGWNRTAALWGALDPEDDVLYLYAEYYRGQAEPAVHAAAIKARGEWIPGVIDPAARGRSQKDGEALKSQYLDLGLTVTDADNAREAGIYETWTRLSTGRLRVFRTLQNWKAEYRIYRRDEKGAIVKESDHLMDDMRYLCMSGVGVATVRPFEQWPGRPGLPVFNRKQTLTADYNPYAEAYKVAGGGQAAPQGQSGWWPGKPSPIIGR